jgi:hypothetical protein
MTSRWIKVHSSIMDSSVWSSDWLTRLWLWCLLKANHADGTYRGETIRRGEFASGRNSASDELGVSPSKWVRGIEQLTSLGCIATKANSHWTTITVCNYSTYQDKRDAKRTSDDTSDDTSGATTVDTSDDTTSGQPVTQPADTSKNNRRTRTTRRTENTNTASGFAEWYALYPRKESRGQAGKAYAAALAKVSHEVLMEAVKNYAAAVLGRVPPDKIPHPATWLNGEKWADDPAMWEASAKSSTGNFTKPLKFDNSHANFDPTADYSKREL